MPRAKDRDLITAAVLEHVRAGATLKVACQAAGVTDRTFREWRRNVPPLSSALKKAEAEWEAAAIVQIADHGRKNWQATAWLLERRYPQRYGKRVIPMEPPKETETGVLVRVPAPKAKPEQGPADV